MKLAIDLQPTRALVATLDADGIRDLRRIEPLAADLETSAAQVAAAMAVLAERTPTPWTSVGVAAGRTDGAAFAAALQARTGQAVAVRARGTALAWGEARFGAGRSCPDFAYLRLGDVLTGGLVLDGAPWTRHLDFGHLPVDPHGPPCACGIRGCLDRYASEAVLDALARDLAVPCAAPTLVPGEGGVYAELAWRAAAGEAQVQAVVAQATRAVGIALGGVVRAFDVPLVLLSAGQREHGPDIAAKVLAELRHHAGRPVAIELALLDDDAALLGVP